MIHRRSMLALSAAALAALPFGARGASPSVVATTGMIGDAARRLSGGAVTTLMGPGMDPHGHRPTRSDILALSRADLVLWHGLNLEAQFTELMADLAARGPVVAVAEALSKDLLLADPAYPDRPDPHVWFDPALWAQVVDRIARTLTDTTGNAAVADRAVAYGQEIAALDDYARLVLATVQPEARVLITAHDAFGYFGRAYGFEVQGIQGISTDSEAGLARVGELVDLIVARDIRAVFVESSVSDRSIRALIEGAAAKGQQVGIGGQLFSDAMGPEGSHEGTWIGMVDHNVTLIARALGGQAPERGMSGKLGGAS